MDLLTPVSRFDLKVAYHVLVLFPALPLASGNSKVSLECNQHLFFSFSIQSNRLPVGFNLNTTIKLGIFGTKYANPSRRRRNMTAAVEQALNN